MQDLSTNCYCLSIDGVYSADVNSAHVVPSSNYPNRIGKESPLAKMSMDEIVRNLLLTRNQSLYPKFSGQD